MPRVGLAEHQALSELKIESILVTEESRACGHSTIDLDVRKKTGALVVALRRNDELREDPSAHEPFAVGDVVYLVGSHKAVRAAIALLDGGPPADDPQGPLPEAESPQST